MCLSPPDLDKNTTYYFCNVDYEKTEVDKMTFIDAKILLKTAVDNKILIYACPEKTHIYMYHAANGNEPEGWYADNIDDVARSLMYDKEAQQLFVDKLKSVGVTVKWFDWNGFNELFDVITKLAGCDKTENCSDKEYAEEFECNFVKEECVPGCDIWAAAFYRKNEKQGAEYNFCIQDDGNNCCAIYKMYLNPKTDMIQTDYSTHTHYEIDFNVPDWEEQLKKAMAKAVEDFFPEETYEVVVDGVVISTEFTDYFEACEWAEQNDNFNYEIKAIKKEDESLKRYLAAIKAEYVRDATAFLGQKLKNIEDIHSYECDDYWCNVKAPVIVLDVFVKSEREVWERLKRLYPEADTDIFEVIFIQEEHEPSYKMEILLNQMTSPLTVHSDKKGEEALLDLKESLRSFAENVTGLESLQVTYLVSKDGKNFEYYDCDEFSKSDLQNLKKEKELKLLEFRVEPELYKFTDSMLFDSGEDEIAYSKWSYGDEIMEVYIQVSGEVAVTYKDVTYHKSSKFPDALKEIIKANPYEWDTSEDIYVGMNNWFEYIWKGERSSDGDVIEFDLSKASGNRILEDMEYYARQYFKIKDGDVKVSFPEYSIYGYDKDNNICALYGMLEEQEEAVKMAKEYKSLLDEGRLLRYRPDMQGEFIPLDLIMVTKTFDEEHWLYNSSIHDFYEKNHLLKSDFTSGKVKVPACDAMTYI